MGRPEIPIYGAFCFSLSRTLEELSGIVDNEEELIDFLKRHKVWPTAVIEREDKSSPATLPEGEEADWYFEKEEIKNLKMTFSKN